MRYSTLIGSVTLSTFFGCSLLLAQHGGGGHSGGSSHGSGSGAHSSGGFARTGAVAPIAPAGVGLQTYYSGYTGINPGAIPATRFGQNYNNGRRGYGAGFYSYYPYLFSSYDDYPLPLSYAPYGEDPNAQTAQVTANLMAEQAQQVQISQYAPAPYVAAPQANDPPIILVLTNGTKVTLQSYAVMGQTIWDFSRQPARKIPVTSVNVVASQQATEASGAEFPALN
jgi:hypothetical protein